MSPVVATVDEGRLNITDMTIPQGSRDAQAPTGNGSALADVQLTDNEVPYKPTGKEVLPLEIINEIIGLAMTARDGKIHLPCLTNAPYKPNIGVVCLRVK